MCVCVKYWLNGWIGLFANSRNSKFQVCVRQMVVEWLNWAIFTNSHGKSEFTKLKFQSRCATVHQTVVEWLNWAIFANSWKKKIKFKYRCVSNAGWMVELAFSRIRESDFLNVCVRQTQVEWLNWHFREFAKVHFSMCVCVKPLLNGWIGLFVNSRNSKFKCVCASNGGWMVELSYFCEFAKKKAKISM